MDLVTGAPKNELAPETISEFRKLGVAYKTVSDVCAAGPDSLVCALKSGINY